MRIEDMTSEQIEKAKECETTEQRLAFIKEIGLELSDEQLDTIAGGGAIGCFFGFHDLEKTGAETGPWNGRLKEFRCKDCGETFWY